MTVPLPPSGAYRAALEAARAKTFSLRLDALKELDRALLDYANQLEAGLVKIPFGENAELQQLAVKRSIVVIRQAEQSLMKTMETAIAENRDVAFDEILKVQQQASIAVAADTVPMAAMGAVLQPNLSMAGVWESLGSGTKTWRTLLRSYGAAAASDAQRVVTYALLSGMAPDELSKRLRPYVLGAETFREAFKGADKEITDKMLRDPHYSGASRVLRYNADRIAFSEIQNARAEAEIQAFATDPFVKAVRWQLSPNRGTQRKRDACDGLAQTDFFGLGRGIYPVTQVPIHPHPFCRCERVPITRPISEMHTPKPNPPKRKEVIVLGTGCAS